MNEMFAPERIATDTIDFCKSATLNAYNTMFIFQEQAERLFTIIIEQGLNAQKEGMKLWQEWLTNNKKTRDEFNKMMDQNFERAQEFFAPRKAA